MTQVANRSKQAAEDKGMSHWQNLGSTFVIDVSAGARARKSKGMSKQKKNQRTVPLDSFCILLS